MFNGIVQSIGTIVRVTPQDGGILCAMRTGMKRRFKKGESVLIDGICSTVISLCGDILTIFYMEETLQKTHASSYSAGMRVNLEPSLRLGEDLSGHSISGHVDGVGVIRSIHTQGKMSVFSVSLPRALFRHIVEKGSVAVDGVSLTVVSCTKSQFSFSLIPYTTGHTTLGLKKIGNRVNIETDIIAKYVEKFLR